MADGLLEINRDFILKNGTVIEPYAEAGVDCAFSRPNNGQILTGDLSYVDTSPWSGSISAGARMLLAKSLFIEASARYLSIGQSDLDIWEGRLFLSYGF